MKPKHQIIALLLFVPFLIIGQTPKTLVLQPDACRGKDATIGDCIPCGYYNQNSGTNNELSAIAWTRFGDPSNGRGLIQFDLSSIHRSAKILQARLSLYWNPNPSSGNPGHSQRSGPNDMRIQRITSDWSEHIVTWANQPATTTENQVLLSPSLSDTQDYTDIDVTTLVQDMIANPSEAYGFMLVLENESFYRSVLFASSDHANSALHPKLELIFTSDSLPVKDTTSLRCVSFQPNNMCSNGNGKGSAIGDCPPYGYNDLNFDDAGEFSAIAWTNNGHSSNRRGLTQFDLSSIPVSAKVISANLSLFWNPNPASGNPGHSLRDGSNACWLQRIISPWDQHTVTWNNQPGTTTQNQVYLPASISLSQNYPNINVTELIQDMIINPSQSFGLMLKLETESYYRSLMFASGTHPNSALHPILEICYTISTKVNKVDKTESGIHVSPNPFNGIFNIRLDQPIHEGKINLYNLTGKCIYSDVFNGDEKTININLTGGVYFLQIKNGFEIRTVRIISK